VPKKPKLPEPEIHALIIREAKYRLGCSDFEPDFTLHERVPGSGGASGESANWNVRETRNTDTWAPDCADAFKEAVARARRNYDISW